MNVEQLVNQRICVARLIELRRQKEVVEMWLASAAPPDCRTQLEELLLSAGDRSRDESRVKVFRHKNSLSVFVTDG
jgi:hypothetical protein